MLGRKGEPNLHFSASQARYGQILAAASHCGN
jgi:hypothetical protein